MAMLLSSWKIKAYNITERTWEGISYDQISEFVLYLDSCTKVSMTLESSFSTIDYDVSSQR